MRNINATKVIISAYSKDNSAATNERAENELCCDLSLVDSVEHVRDVEGRYQGHEECSQLCFLRPGSIQEGIDALTDLAAHYKQSSILVVHGDNAAELVGTYNNRSGTIIGTFRAVDAPLPGEDYTKADGLFYVVR